MDVISSAIQQCTVSPNENSNHIAQHKRGHPRNPGFNQSWLGGWFWGYFKDSGVALMLSKCFRQESRFQWFIDCTWVTYRFQNKQMNFKFLDFGSNCISDPSWGRRISKKLTQIIGVFVHFFNLNANRMGQRDPTKRAKDRIIRCQSMRLRQQYMPCSEMTQFT